MYHSFCNLQFQTQKNGLNEQFTEKTTAPNEPWFSVSISTKRELIGRERRSRRPVISNECHEITKQPVILSAVELLRVERSEQAKARCIAPQGSPNKFEWLLNRGNIPSKSDRESLRDPACLTARGFSSLFARKNFDSAQDDIQWVCLGFVR